MKKKLFALGLLSCFCALFVFAGCGAPAAPSEPPAGELLAEETASSRTQSGESVEYAVEVTQDRQNLVTVRAGANTAFFDGLEYEADCGAPLSGEDVDVQWTTLMGDPEPKEDDQLAIAVVTLSKDGKLFDQRKINFVSRAVKIIGEALAQEQQKTDGKNRGNHK